MRHPRRPCVVITARLGRSASAIIYVPLELSFAFLKQEDLTLDALLKRLPIANRPNALVPPREPPYFCSIDRERRARMTEQCARPGRLQTRVRDGWLALFTPPPPPSFVPPEAFGAKMKAAVAARYANTKSAIDKLRARGGKVVFVRFPISGALKEFEDRGTPRKKTWDPLLQQTAAPASTSKTSPSWRALPAPNGRTCPPAIPSNLRSASCRICVTRFN
ncbi:MAG: hypothetical protein H0U43_05800 [Chthoniobacterales bacterium]|nr:hypothetical protein [Chthoniobacterales bacterium]